MFHRTSYLRNEEKLRGEILKINGETTKVENFRSGKVENAGGRVFAGSKSGEGGER